MCIQAIHGVANSCTAKKERNADAIQSTNLFPVNRILVTCQRLVKEDIVSFLRVTLLEEAVRIAARAEKVIILLFDLCAYMIFAYS